MFSKGRGGIRRAIRSRALKIPSSTFLFSMPTLIRQVLTEVFFSVKLLIPKRTHFDAESLISITYKKCNCDFSKTLMNVKLTRTTAVGERPALTRKDRFTANAPQDSLVMVLLALVSGCLMCTQRASQVFIAHVASTFGLGQSGVDFRPTLKRPATRERKKRLHKVMITETN